MQRTAEKIEYDENLELLTRYAKAHGHPVRLTILKHLGNWSYCFTGDLVDVLPLAHSPISQELKDAGLIKWEVCSPKVKYCINLENWKKAKRLFAEFFGEYSSGEYISYH